MPFTVTTRPGTDMPGIGTVSNGPTARASRYEGSGGVRLKTTVFDAPAGVSLSTGVLETARLAAGTMRVSWYGILNEGSSQQGKARRASVASNWVNAYQSSPAWVR